MRHRLLVLLLTCYFDDRFQYDPLYCPEKCVAPVEQCDICCVSVQCKWQDFLFRVRSQIMLLLRGRGVIRNNLGTEFLYLFNLC